MLSNSKLVLRLQAPAKLKSLEIYSRQIQDNSAPPWSLIRTSSLHIIAMATSALNVYSSTVPHCYVQCAKWKKKKIIPRLVVIHGGPNKPSPSWSFISGVKNNHKQPLSGRFMIGFTKETPWDRMGFWDVSELYVSEMCPGNIATVIKAAVMMTLVLQCQALQHTCNALERKRRSATSGIRLFPKILRWSKSTNKYK